jgi:hypothetical protein
MTSENKARAWLRANGYSEIADQIDGVMDGWRARGVETRKNWWDVLAGNKEGAPCVVAGIEFPVLASARRRKGWPRCDNEIAPRPGEVTPQKNDGGRHAKKTSEGASHARSRRPMTTMTTNDPGSRSVYSQSRGTPAGRHSGDAHQHSTSLSVEKFAQLEKVVIPLTELVVLVGPQATGKSLVLELLKLAVDRNRVVRVLKQHGYKWESPEEFAALYFGGGFDKSWTQSTQFIYQNERVTLDDVAGGRQKKGEDAVFYIPAHRTLAIADGWPRPFSGYQIETPYVARRFSEELLTWINQGLIGKGKIFPHPRRLKDAFRQLIDDAIFHGATLKLDLTGMRKQFVLEYGDNAKLPFMAWTAGQREFTPLLLGLYQLLPPGGSPNRKKGVRWVVIEEPEMGLHPKAIVAVMVVVLDLLARGYKVALSTHSQTVLEVVWGMSRLKGMPDGPARLCRIMGLPDKDRSVLKTAEDALKRSHSVIHLHHRDDGRVVSDNISNLDPGAESEYEWA